MIANGAELMFWIVTVMVIILLLLVVGMRIAS